MVMPRTHNTATSSTRDPPAVTIANSTRRTRSSANTIEANATNVLAATAPKNSPAITRTAAGYLIAGWRTESSAHRHTLAAHDSGPDLLLGLSGSMSPTSVVHISRYVCESTLR